jgi:hypothetical protein
LTEGEEFEEFEEFKEFKEPLGSTAWECFLVFEALRPRAKAVGTGVLPSEHLQPAASGAIQRKNIVRGGCRRRLRFTVVQMLFLVPMSRALATCVVHWDSRRYLAVHGVVGVHGVAGVHASSFCW